MIKITTLALATAFAAAAMAPSAMAQSASPKIAHKARAPHYESGRPLYNMAPGTSSPLGRDTPAGTGGGSTGYNQMLYNS
ncbi:MAG TPA: hypothetical protein VH206_23880 [Xanthobacteraceae bacterium]|nr:hypothetical protein [Xanthobacteraceae bacterium]